MAKKCEACGYQSETAKYISINTTNGHLLLCRLCLNDMNAKNPQVLEWERFFGMIREYAADPDSMRRKWGEWLKIPWVDSLVAELKRDRVV